MKELEAAKTEQENLQIIQLVRSMNTVSYTHLNIKQYLRAMLFNAPSTINSYYASLVAHDMAQPDWGRPSNT